MEYENLYFVDKINGYMYIIYKRARNTKGRNKNTKGRGSPLFSFLGEVQKRQDLVVVVVGEVPLGLVE